MDDMDIDQVVEIPNTPDRPAARHINAGDFVGKHNKLSVAGRLKNSDFIDEECLNQPRAQGRPVNENGHNRRFHIHTLSNSGNIDKVEQSSNSIAFSPLENPHASCNASIFRRTTIDKNSKHDTRNPFGAHHMDKGKVTCSKFPSKSSSFREGLASLDLPIQNGCGKMKDLPAKVIQEVQIAANGSSSHWPPIFPKMSGNSSKGKEKIGEDSIMGREKGINLSSGSHHNNESQVSASHHSVVSPRIGRQRRLVQNGCISPHNIEIRAKQLAEHSENCSKDAEKDHSVDVVHSGPRTIDIRHVVAEDNDRCRSKGIRIHSCTLNERDPEVIHLSSSSTTKHGETNGNGHASGDAFRCTEGLGGCRSTHNHSKKVDHSLPDSTGPYSRRNDGIGCVLELDQISESRHVANAFSKRQKKHESTSRNHRESSRTLSDDSEIVFLSSSAESSRSRSSRIQRHQHQRILDVDELTPEVRHSGSQGIDCSNDDDSDARARQLEADEQLAVELQEQLYHESAVFGGDEIDENVAWVLQQEEDALRFSNHNHHMLHPRTSSTSYRQPQSWLLQSASHRRGTRAEVHNSTRVTQLRNRLLNRSRAAPSRARNFQFPLDMDLDMRLDILETLEAAVGDLTDMEPVSHISQLQRDFNENDYEMLLALDENNCQRGASTNQINSLPLSIVQTDDYEACAICLDTPTIGESIRHLPCMHKFHKACIDPWLSRSTSCPVCKSSIT